MVETLSVIAALFVAVETAAIIVLRILLPGYDPIRDAVSHYGVSPYRGRFLWPAAFGGLAWPPAPRPPPARPAATREGVRDRCALSLRRRREPPAFPPRPTRPRARVHDVGSGDHVRCGPRLRRTSFCCADRHSHLLVPCLGKCLTVYEGSAQLEGKSEGTPKQLDVGLTSPSRLRRANSNCNRRPATSLAIFNREDQYVGRSTWHCRRYLYGLPGHVLDCASPTSDRLQPG